MLKNILKLSGAQELSKTEQIEINGGQIIGTGGGNMCVCTLVNYGTPQDPLTNNGVGMTFSTTYTEGAIPVGFVNIYPVPECCKPSFDDPN